MSKKRKSVPNRSQPKRPKPNAPSKGGPPPKKSKLPPPPPPKGAPAPPKNTQPIRPLNPFPRGSSVLLLGEGDLSFSHLLSSARRSLRPSSLVATTFDPLPSVLSKYPTTAPHHLSGLASPPAKTTVSVLHGIDATKLTSYRPVKKQRYDVVGMLFPHVGGKTKDRDRQIRANQVLLLGMFRGAREVLERGGRVAVALFEGEVYEAWGIRGLAREAGLVGVTGGVFDAGLWVKGEEEQEGEESEEEEEGSEFGFGQGLVDDEPPTEKEKPKAEEEKPEPEDGEKADSEKQENKPEDSTAAPKVEYRHARTLGEIEGGGAWQGEKRKARWYVFCRKGEEAIANQIMGVGAKNKPKRKRGDESSDDEEETEGIVRSKGYKNLIKDGMDAGRAMLIRQLDG